MKKRPRPKKLYIQIGANAHQPDHVVFIIVPYWLRSVLEKGNHEFVLKKKRKKK